MKSNLRRILTATAISMGCLLAEHAVVHADPQNTPPTTAPPQNTPPTTAPPQNTPPTTAPPPVSYTHLTLPTTPYV